jgi:hypothetical protein
MILGGVLAAFLVSASATRAGDPVIIDMPPPVGDEPTTYQQHENGEPSLGALALARYSGARSRPRPTTPAWGPLNVVGFAWASTWPAGPGGWWGGRGWGWGPRGAWGWGSPAWGWWGWRGCGEWGYPSWGVGPARPTRAIRSTSSSFRRQPFGRGG